jgi:hypothetical protein
VIAGYDYGDVDIERSIIEEAGFELITDAGAAPLSPVNA